jgi:hypothetical protein
MQLPEDKQKIVRFNDFNLTRHELLKEHTPVVPVPAVTSMIIEPCGAHIERCFMKRRIGFWYLLRVAFSILNFLASAKEGKLILFE